jgi:hypothetical protein
VGTFEVALHQVHDRQDAVEPRPHVGEARRGDLFAQRVDRRPRVLTLAPVGGQQRSGDRDRVRDRHADRRLWHRAEIRQQLIGGPPFARFDRELRGVRERVELGLSVATLPGGLGALQDQTHGVRILVGLDP